MSLKDRVDRVQGTCALHQERTDEELFSELRRHMNEHLSNGLLSVAKTAPLRVENEIRSLCQTVFSQVDWADVSQQRKERLMAQLIDSVFGFGPLNELLADSSVTEIMVNGPEKVYVERSGRLEKTAVRFVDNEQILALIDRIVGPLGRRID